MTLADGAQKDVNILALIDEEAESGVLGGGAADARGGTHGSLNDEDSSSSSSADASAPVSAWLKSSSVVRLERA